jgi:hypothetical protein
LVGVPKGQSGEYDFFLCLYVPSRNNNAWFRLRCKEAGVWEEVNIEDEQYQAVVGIANPAGVGAYMLEVREGAFKDWIALKKHFILDVAGIIPFVGSIADGINGYLYLKEGEPGVATMYFYSAVIGFVVDIGITSMAARAIKEGQEEALTSATRKIWSTTHGEIDLDIILGGARSYGMSDLEIKAMVEELSGKDGGFFLIKFTKEPELINAWKYLNRAGFTNLSKQDFYKVEKLAGDFKVNTNLAAAFDGNAGLVKAWDVLHPVNTVSVEVRTNVDRLTDLARYIEGNPGNISIVRSELGLLTTNVNQYLDYIKHVGTDREHFYYTFRLFNEAKGRSWKEYLNWLDNHNAFKPGAPYEGMTYEQVIDMVLQSGTYSNLTKSDALIAFSYTTGYFFADVNKWIRNGEHALLIQSIMPGVIESLQKLPKFTSSSTFYRGIEVTDNELPEFLAKYVAGADVSQNFIQSMAPRIEDTFIGRLGYNVEFEIRGKIGLPSEARNVHDFAWAKYWNTTNPLFPRTQSEGLFLPNTPLRVVEVLPPSNGNYKFILEEF